MRDNIVISLILAVSKNGVIGADNELPWRIATDFKSFKRNTLNNVVIMGRKTWQSLGSPLKKRVNIVITSQQNLKSDYSDVYFVNSIAESLNLAQQKAKELNSSEIFVIGGSNIYAQMLPHAEFAYVTLVDATIKGDSYFDLALLQNWRCEDLGSDYDSSLDDYNYRFLKYSRI